MVSNNICPVSNPQTCCQVVLEKNIMLYPLAICETIEVTKKIEVLIEKVCPEKVIISGKLKRKIVYKYLNEFWHEAEKILEDDIPIQCFIDRDDANLDDEFTIVGAEILCNIYEQENNLYKASDYCGNPVCLVYEFAEKDIIKICIRKCIDTDES